MSPGGEAVATAVVCSVDGSSLEAICDHLADRGFGPLSATGAAAASRLCRYGRADALILDLDLPEVSVTDLLRERAEAPGFLDIAVLAIASRDGDPPPAVDDAALAIDELLTRPFDLDHMVHRLETVLRRRHGRHDAVLRLGDLVVDPGRRKVIVGDHEVRLAKKEFALLRVLASDPTRVFAKEELLRDFRGLRGPAAKACTLDSHASRLRRKLDRDGRRYVVNCWGVGYRLVDSVDVSGPAAEAGGEDR